MIEFFGLLAAAIILIIFAHSYVEPQLVFTSMIAGLSGIVGTRIASNGYERKKDEK